MYNRGEVYWSTLNDLHSFHCWALGWGSFRAELGIVTKTRKLKIEYSNYN